ncbi:MAG: hypothetical protein B6U76_07220 [Desulfurococcales archaeon ex4484_217_2]|nr:MAG: hypothetical protein B6U76_07220 [Desulfurococcales archaeon ex4484_217_2]
MPSRLEKFVKNWDDNPKPSVKERISRMIHPPPPMRYKLAMALYKVKIQVNRLEHLFNKLQERDKMLFEKVVSAQMMKDNARAAIYANEVAEVRKIAKTVLRAQLALEQVALRLETVRELGDVLVTMAPIVEVIKDIKQHLKGIVPEIAFELDEIDSTLHSIVLEAGEFTGTSIDSTIVSGEAKKILEEASIIAEQRMKEKFPELPLSGISTGESASLPAPPK